MKRILVALILGFIFLVPETGWSAQPGGALPEQVASLAAQVTELQGLVANLTTQLNNEVTARTAGDTSTLTSAKAYTDQQVANEVARQAAHTVLRPRLGMPFNELYGQVVRAGCGWLEVVSRKGDMPVYRVTLSYPGCNPKILYYFQDDKLVNFEQGQLEEQR